LNILDFFLEPVFFNKILIKRSLQMKRIIFVALALFAFSVSAFAINSTLHVKGGVQYPDAPDKAGFDSAATLNIGFDKYFTAGAETGFGWIQWKDETSDVAVAKIAGAKVDKTNLYTLPVLGVATIRLADMMETYGFMPYITGGAGYSWTWYRHPDYKDRFDGFTWQVMGGLEVKLGSDSNLSCLIEAGYRSAPVENSDNVEIDMSGFIGRVGVSFPLEMSSDY
jgi:hypothetical protein